MKPKGIVSMRGDSGQAALGGCITPDVNVRTFPKQG